MLRESRYRSNDRFICFCIHSLSPGKFLALDCHSFSRFFFFLQPPARDLSEFGRHATAFFGGRSAFWHMDVITVMGTVTLGLTIILFLRSLAQLNRPTSAFWIPFFKLMIEEKLLLSWIFIYIIFLIFWLPQNTFYRLFYLPPLIFLAACVSHGKIHRSPLSLFVAVTIIWNFTFLIYPYSHTAANEVLLFAVHRSQDWNRNTAVAYCQFHSDLWTISYFNPQVSWINVSGDPGQLENLYSNLHQKGVSLWLEGTVDDSLTSRDGGKAWLSGHIDRERSIIYRSGAHAFRFFRMRD